MNKVLSDDFIFKAIAHETRRQILDLLQKKGKTTGQLCLDLPKLDRCTVMQHLRYLEKAKLVIVKKHGRERWNYLNALPIKRIHESWINQYSSIPLDSLIKLQSRLQG